ncbi:MAG TPA: trigger factor [Candidatus Paceibacterota bacterium]
MKYDAKKLPHSQAELQVTLEHKEFLEYYQPIYDRILTSVHLKGFRPGTAPKDLADKAVDKEKVFEEAATEAIRHTLKAIAEEKEWELVDQPKIDIQESETGLKFKTVLTLFPEIKLGNYQKISKKIFQERKPVTIEEKEIQKSINWLLNTRAKVTRVNRTAEKGDVIDLDFAGSIDGKSLDGASGKADRFVLGEGKFIPGFEEHIIGHKEGDHIAFAITFPADYWKEDLRNKKVDFQTDVRGVFSRELPELNDELVKSLGKFETVAAFETSVREGIQKEKEEKERDRAQLKILEEVGKDSTIDIPQIMIDRTVKGMEEEYRLHKGARQNEEELQKSLQEAARKNVINNLVLFQIAKTENLEPNQAEVEKEANDFLARSQFEKNPKIDPQRLYDYIYGIVRNKKVFEHLESLAK